MTDVAQYDDVKRRFAKINLLKVSGPEREPLRQPLAGDKPPRDSLDDARQVNDGDARLRILARQSETPHCRTRPHIEHRAWLMPRPIVQRSSSNGCRGRAQRMQGLDQLGEEFGIRLIAMD